MKTVERRGRYSIVEHNGGEFESVAPSWYQDALKLIAKAKGELK